MDYLDIQCLKERKEMEEIEIKMQSTIKNRRQRSKEAKSTHTQKRNISELIHRLDSF